MNNLSIINIENDLVKKINKQGLVHDFLNKTEKLF